MVPKPADEVEKARQYQQRRSCRAQSPAGAPADGGAEGARGQECGDAARTTEAAHGVAVERRRALQRLRADRRWLGVRELLLGARRVEVRVSAPGGHVAFHGVPQPRRAAGDTPRSTVVVAASARRYPWQYSRAGSDCRYSAESPHAG